MNFTTYNDFLNEKFDFDVPDRSIVYHRTKEEHVQSILQNGFDRKYAYTGIGSAIYGLGVYCNFDENDMSNNNYGGHIIKCRVKSFKDSCCFIPEIAKKIYGKRWDIMSQLKMHVPKVVLDKALASRYRIALLNTWDRGGDGVSALYETGLYRYFTGVIYWGNNDKSCYLSYDYNNLIPIGHGLSTAPTNNTIKVDKWYHNYNASKYKNTKDEEKYFYFEKNDAWADLDFYSPEVEELVKTGKAHSHSFIQNQFAKKEPLKFLIKFKDYMDYDMCIEMLCMLNNITYNDRITMSSFIHDISNYFDNNDIDTVQQFFEIFHGITPAKIKNFSGVDLTPILIYIDWDYMFNKYIPSETEFIDGIDNILFMDNKIDYLKSMLVNGIIQYSEYLLHTFISMHELYEITEDELALIAVNQNNFKFYQLSDCHKIFDYEYDVEDILNVFKPTFKEIIEYIQDEMFVPSSFTNKIIKRFKPNEEEIQYLLDKRNYFEGYKPTEKTFNNLIMSIYDYTDNTYILNKMFK